MSAVTIAAGPRLIQGEATDFLCICNVICGPPADPGRSRLMNYYLYVEYRRPSYRFAADCCAPNPMRRFSAGGPRAAPSIAAATAAAASALTPSPTGTRSAHVYTANTAVARPRSMQAAQWVSGWYRPGQTKADSSMRAAPFGTSALHRPRHCARPEWRGQSRTHSVSP